TIEAWIRPRRVQGVHVLVAKNTYNRENYLLWHSAGRLIFSYRNAAGNATFSYSSNEALLAIDQWTHVAVSHTFGTQTIAMYAGGLPVEGSWLSPPTTAPHNETGPLFLGMQLTGGVQTRFLDGLIDEVRLWRVTRSPDEIAADASDRLAGNEPGLLA